jgi:large subunit ribosomal protein L6
MPITVPAGVTVSVAEGNVVTVKGPKGELTRALSAEMNINQEGNVITVTRPSDEKAHRSLHGLTRTLLNNMVIGVVDGYKKELDVNGVGYRVAKEGKNLVMNLGYSHQVIVPEIDGITIDVPSPNKIIVSGCDKQVVGQFAAEIREKRPPEPYKGKGIKYVDEVIRRKVGKTGGKK